MKKTLQIFFLSVVVDISAFSQPWEDVQNHRRVVSHPRVQGCNSSTAYPGAFAHPVDVRVIGEFDSPPDGLPRIDALHGGRILYYQLLIEEGRENWSWIEYDSDHRILLTGHYWPPGNPDFYWHSC